MGSMRVNFPCTAFLTRSCYRPHLLQPATRPHYSLQYGYPMDHLLHNLTHSRGAKTVSKRKVKELTQGRLPAKPLPSHEDDEPPQYPPLLQEVRNNMVKFDRCVVLTRVGNFYELYFRHASEYGPLLGLKVAYRNTDLGAVPMAGFPYWQLDKFLKILVQDLNKYVAISEESLTTTPNKVKSAGMQYERKVARVVTPGTLIDENFLDPYQNNFLLALEIENREEQCDGYDNMQDVGLAWLDLSTGDFFTQRTTYALLATVLMRIGPREVLIPSSTSNSTKDELGIIMGNTHELITDYDAASQFTSLKDWDAMLETPLPVSAEGSFTMPEKMASHRLLDYVSTHLNGYQIQLRQPRRREDNDVVNIDRGSLRGLEILQTAKDGLGKGSLFHAVRRTVTKGGSRLLRDRLTSPSASLNEIDDRLDLVTRFINLESLREGVIDCLKRTFDVKRLIQKFAMNKGDPDDMLCLARAILETSNIYRLLQSASNEPVEHLDGNPIQPVLAGLTLSGPDELSQRIFSAIDEDGLNQKHRIEEDESMEVANRVQEVAARDGLNETSALLPKSKPRSRTSAAKAHYEENEDAWIMRKDASESLQSLHDDLDLLKNERTDLQERLRQDLNVAKLELKWTPGLGHVCHISSNKTIDLETISRLEGRMISSSRSTRSLHLPEWSQLGERLAKSRLQILQEEQRISIQLRQLIIDNIVHLRRNAAILDELDLATGFASLAVEQGWTRPQLNSGLTHQIIGGRHPTVKLGLEEQGRTFVSNDLFLGGSERLWLITGPNMAGKSTFLRQNALITILAQVGSYVPAVHAEIGVVDQIFSRIGAADDLSRGQSTFMVEMLETAAILKHATPRSFVIMDEVGRGTTPDDGTAVSFASLHHLYQLNKCRTLFATHFHALIDMTSNWPEIGRYCTDVLEDESGSFTFVHKLKPGVNRQSHALKVAKMAGLPQTALDMASYVQQELRRQKVGVSGNYGDNDLDHHRQYEQISASKGG